MLKTLLGLLIAMGGCATNGGGTMGGGDDDRAAPVVDLELLYQAPNLLDRFGHLSDLSLVNA